MENHEPAQNIRKTSDSLDVSFEFIESFWNKKR